MKTLLFIGHDANRAGAQYLLLHLLTYLHETGVKTGLVLGDGGPLLPDYERVTTVYPLFSPPAVQAGGLRGRVLSKLGVGQPANGQRTISAELLQRIREARYDAILANTIANGGLLRLLEPLGLPFALYVHELETSIRIYARPDDLAYELTRVSHVFCGSEAVRQNLIRHHGLTTGNTSVLNSLIHTQTLLNKLAAVDRRAVRQQLTIPVNAVIVGGCGNAEWRKGVDLFLLVARQVLNTHPDTYFVWVGVNESGEEARRLRYDLVRMGIANRVHLLPPGGNYLDYVACFDLFTLTSREDPYPLVILEAGLNHNPVLCFAQSGGSPDYVGTDTGCLVPYLDLSAMARVIGQLADDKAERNRLGVIFYERALRHDVAALVPQLLAKLDLVVAQPTAVQYGSR
ncbi:glycosyltransferase family 4 protein [Spirosoma utsteinense]|uniref:Glycosyltransferase involved in cell wall biosynthesis n=1 Tax=Spirosoma utsteinense TaxID=2585773 RepID=A0ABR6W7L7_9BACT|nr:glycosyltransferase family 4 protein [Spirosoma utsteinense]MBC3786325.1 glycosyltransferase involved in cell wall biosynthesis [Spirosoma utsteinense]MBC3791951.1 glycosyltransferase involved in cell wall biosynthesis [Spirosoma utsteinense]